MGLPIPEFDAGRLGRNYLESRKQFVDVMKSSTTPFKNPNDSSHSDVAKSLIGLGSRAERCPTLRYLALALVGVKTVSFLRNLVVYPDVLKAPSMYWRGRIAPVMHHRRPHNIF